MLFFWDHVEVLRAYRAGGIFVEANSVEQAREFVVRDFEAYLRTRYDYLFYNGQPFGEDAAEELEGKRAQLLKDLELLPVQVTKGAIFVEGSE